MDAYINGGVVEAGSVAIRADSHVRVSASANNGSGGAIAVGNAKGTITVDSYTDAYVGTGARILTTGDVAVEAFTSTIANGSLRAKAVGGISVVNTETMTIKVDFHTTAAVKGSADVLAGGAVRIAAQTATDSRSTAWASGLGFGADGHSEAKTLVGLDGGADTAATVGANARVTGNSVTMSALVDNMTLPGTTEVVKGLNNQADSESYGAGVYSEGVDDATADATLNTTVTIGAGAQVTGWEGVDLRTRYNHVTTYADSFARSTGLFGYVDADGRNTTTLNSSVTGTDNARVTAGPNNGYIKNENNANPDGYSRLALYVTTDNGAVLSAGRDGHVSKRSLAAGSGDEHGDGLVVNRGVVFDSDVLILSGRSPRLVVDTNGVITQAVNVTVGPTNQTSGPVAASTIVVNDITNPGPGTVYFDSPNISSNGAKGTWTFRDTLTRVTLSNASAKPMQVNDITVATTAQPIVDFQGGNVTIRFHIRRDVAPTIIEILGTHAAVAPATDGPAITINGVIDNPIGTTIVRNEFGPILGSGTRAVDTFGDPASLIRTNILVIEAPNSLIGTATTRLNVDTVAVEDAAGQSVYPQATTFAPAAASATTDTIYLANHPFLPSQLVRLSGSGLGLAAGVYVVIASADGQSLRLAAVDDPTVPLALDPAGTGALSLTAVQRFMVASEDSLYLDVRGVLRVPDPSAVASHTVLIDGVSSESGDADILMQPALKQTGLRTSAGILVRWPENTNGLTHVNYFTPDSGTAPTYGLGLSGSGTANVASTWVVKSPDASGALTNPGMTAGGNIILEAAAPTIDPAPTATPVKRIDVDAITEITGTGHVDVLTNGEIAVTEETADLRVGRIRSNYDDVTLFSPEAIVDALDDAGPGVEADVSGVNITLEAGLEGVRGGIGTPDNWLEIDVDILGGTGEGLGVVNADDTTAPVSGTAGIFLTETSGDFQVDTIQTVSDVALSTVAGSILDARNGGAGDGDWNIQGRSIDLFAHGGSIGSPDGLNDLEIDSSFAGLFETDDVALEASSSILVTETDGTLRLVWAYAKDGNVQLTVRESEDLDEDLILVASGSAYFGENPPLSPFDIPIGTIFANGLAPTGGNVQLRVGDNITTSANSRIWAAGQIDIYGDWTNLDPGYGSTMVFRGDITAGYLVNGSNSPPYLTEIFGNTDVDTIQFGRDPAAVGQAGSTIPMGELLGDPGYIHLGSQTRAYGSATATTSATTPTDDGEDRFFVFYLQTMDVAAGHSLTLDGQAETDSYTVHTTGSRASATGIRNYVINLLDTGAPADGADVAAIYGADNPDPAFTGYQDGTTTPAPNDDVFLLRASTCIPAAGGYDCTGTNETADSPAFVALLHGSVATYADLVANNEPTTAAQRINYDTALNGRLTVYGQAGNDHFYVDDTTVTITLDGGVGFDNFQIGQVFGTKRDEAEGGVAPQDLFPSLIATTRGWLSPGTHAPLVATGGTGNDSFTVYSNQAELRLEGDDDSDLFVVRAFALAQTCDDVNGDGVCDAPGTARTATWTDDLIPLDENGLPRPIIGSPALSTGRPLDIRTGGGEDEVQYNINAPVSVDGGTGIDKVVLLGTEFADDIVVTATSINGAGINLRYTTVEIVEIDGLEGDDEFFVLSTAFGVAYRIIGGLGSDTINVAGDVTEDIVVRELEGVSGSVDHLVQSDTDAAYDGLTAGGLQTTVVHDDGIVVIEQTNGTRVTEGGTIDSYTVRLAQRPTATVYVTVAAAAAPHEEASNAASVNAANLAENLPIGEGDTVWLCTTASGSTCAAPSDFQRFVYLNGVLTPIDTRALVLTFTAADYDIAQSVYVYAPDDARSEGDRVVVVQHSVLSDDPAYDGLAVVNVEVSVRDNDTPGLRVTEVVPGTSGEDVRTVVVEGSNDPVAGGAYTGVDDEILLELATDPGDGVTVVVSLTLDAASSQAIILSSADARWNATTLTLTFTGGAAGNWDDAVRLAVRAADDSNEEDPQTAVIAIGCASDGTCGTGTAYPLVNLRSGLGLMDVLVIDDDTPGVLITETDTSTALVGDDPNTPADETLLPAGQDSYTIRLTKRPDGTVTIAVLTDGLTDVVTIDGTPAVLAEIGKSGESGKPGEGHWSGDATTAVDAEPTDPSDLGGRRITRSDSSSWLADGFLEGQRVRVTNADNPAESVDLKIAVIRGTNSTNDETLQFTAESVTPAWWQTASALTVVRLGAVATFDGSTWYQEQDVVLKADPLYSVPLVRLGSKTYPASTHLLSAIQGPLAVEGGVSGEDRSLRSAVKLPGELDGPSFSIAAQAPESRQIDTLNIFNDSSRQDLSGILTSTNLSGFAMGRDLVFEGSNPFGDPMEYPGGISFASAAGTSTIEVLNMMLGQGNDTLDVQGTLDPAAVVSSTGTFDYAGSTVTREGPVTWSDFGFLPGQALSISGVAGSWVITGVSTDGLSLTLDAPLPADIAGAHTVTSTDPTVQGGGTAAGSATGGTVTRTSGSWVDDGFVAGQRVILDGQTGEWRVVAVADLTVTLAGEALTAGARTVTVPGPHGVLTVIHGGGNRLLTLNGSMTGGDGTLTRADGLAWTGAGFAVGQQVQLDGESTTRTVTGFADATCPPPAPGETGNPACGLGAIMLLSGGTVESGRRTVHVAAASKVETTSPMGLTRTPDDPALIDSPTVSTLTRADGGSFVTDGFLVGMQIWVSGVAGMRTIAAVSPTSLTLLGSQLHGLDLGAPVTVFGYDPDFDGGVAVGGDAITVCNPNAVDADGDPVPCGDVVGGPDSLLVIYGDTSQDGVWYSGDPYTVDDRDFGLKPFDPFFAVPDEDETWVFPVGNPFDHAGNDVITAANLFAGVAAADLPTVGLTIYGGPGDDVIIGSQAGDHLAGAPGTTSSSARAGWTTSTATTASTWM